MTATKRRELARALLAALRDTPGGPLGRLEFLDKLEAECAPESHPVIHEARRIVRNGR